MAQQVAQCPRCGSQMVANVQQIFDLAQDPQAKEKLLSGQINTAVCTSCGFASPLGLPIVYHDPEKQLFLTYFPQELNKTLPEQEKIMGPLIRRVMDGLPQEKRLGYIFSPKSMYSYDTLLETILEADGITKEMLNEQEGKIRLLQQLIQAADDSIPVIIDQDLTPYDRDFFALLSNLQASAMQTDNQAALHKIKIIQDQLIEKTDAGRELKARAESTQKALLDLQSLGENLNTETLLDLVLASPDDAYLQTIVGLARNGMDYRFFEQLTAKIDSADEAVKAKYTQIRETALAMIKDIDTAVQEQKNLRRQAFDAILNEADKNAGVAGALENAIAKYARAIDDAFIEVANEALEKARQSGNFERSGKIQALLDKIEEMTKLPPEVEFLESLIRIEDLGELTATLEANKADVTAEFKVMLDRVLEGLNREGVAEDPALVERLKLIKTIIES